MTRVQQAAISARVRRIPAPRGVYTYRADRPHRWLQRLCLAVLEHLRAYDLPIREIAKVYTFGPVEAEKLHKAIGRQLLDIIRFEGYALRPKNLYIGSDDFSEITDNPSATVFCDRLTMRSPKMHQGVTDSGSDLWLEPYDIKIVIVPWMKGWVLL